MHITGEVEYRIGSHPKSRYWDIRLGYEPRGRCCHVVRTRDAYVVCNISRSGEATPVGNQEMSFHPLTPEGRSRAVSLCIYAATGIPFAYDSGPGPGS